MLESRKIEVATWEKAAELVALEFGPIHGYTATKIAARLYAAADGRDVADLADQVRARKVQTDAEATAPPRSMKGRCDQHGPYHVVCVQCVKEKDGAGPGVPGGTPANPPLEPGEGR